MRLYIMKGYKIVSDITDAIAIMDEKGRRLAGGKTIGLWEKDWDWLRTLLLGAKLKTEQDKIAIRELRKHSIYQQVDTIEAGAVVTGVRIGKL